MNRLDHECLLLVEDNPGDAELIRELLRGGGARKLTIVHATSIAEGVAFFGELEIDAVLLDLRLPDGDGIECVERVHRAAPHVPIVALTGIESEKLALECLAAGAQDYISKDEMRAASLIRAIGYAIARSREGEARRRVAALRQRLAGIVDGSTDAIISCAPDGILTSWNPGAAEIFGFSYDEAIGQRVEDIIRAPEYNRPEQSVLMRLANHGTFGAPRELERLRKDGRIVYLSAVAFPLAQSDGFGPGFGAICRDVTEKRAQEEQLRRQNARLLARDRAMSALAARLNAIREEERIRISREVHDELGQLLTGLKMDLRWAGKRLDPGSPALAKLGEAEGLADRTIATVQRIAAELRPSVLDALGLPAAIRDEVRRFEERTGVTASIDVRDGPLPLAEISTELFRILQEVLTNITRHARAAAVSVMFGEDEADWVLRVRDDGVGFVHEPDAGVASLGLLGMHERTRQLDGTLEIDSRPGLGTKVTVRIPKVIGGRDE